MTSQFQLNATVLSSSEPAQTHEPAMTDDLSPAQARVAGHLWQDEVWMRRRSEDWQSSIPLSIYRLNPAAWRLDDQGDPLGWWTLAGQLVPYVADLGFTHIELKGVSRDATDREFAFFIDHCHQGGIGVILEWPPASGSGQGGTPEKQSLLDDVINHLQAFHLDGLRLVVDGTGKEDGAATSEDMLRDLLKAVAASFPNVLVLSDPGPRAVGMEGPLSRHHLAWNTAWSCNTLAYLCEPPQSRHAHHDLLVSGLSHAFDDHYVLPLADDESSEGRNTWLGRMPGDEWQRFATLRAGLGFMWAHPGKKLLGMGTEFAQGRGWRQDGTLDWSLFSNPYHMGVFRLVADLNRIYVTEPALHIRDRSPRSFAWVVGDDSRNSVIAFLRYGDEGMAPVLAIVNFTPTVHHDYCLGVPALGVWREILNTDSEFYGGSNVGNASGARAEQLPSHGYHASLSLTIPPLATLLLRQGDWPS